LRTCKSWLGEPRILTTCLGGGGGGRRILSGPGVKRMGGRIGEKAMSGGERTGTKRGSVGGPIQGRGECQMVLYLGWHNKEGKAKSEAGEQGG